MSTKAFFLNGNDAYYGQDEWNYVQKILFEQGILHTEGATWNDFIDLEVIQNGTPDMSVDVKVGASVVEITKTGETFKVFAFNLDQTNLAITNNISGANRLDAIIMRIDVDVDPNALLNNIATVEVITGTSAVALTDGAIQTAIGSDGFIRLADVTVTNGATTVVTANIADTRTRSGFNDSILFNPTTINFKVVTADPAGADLVEGLVWFNSTTHYLKYYDGSGVVTLIPASYLWGDGLAASGATISVDLATNSGLNFSTAKLRIGAGNGLAISAGTTNVDLRANAALSFTSGQLDTTISDIQANILIGGEDANSLHNHNDNTGYYVIDGLDLTDFHSYWIGSYPSTFSSLGSFYYVSGDGGAGGGGAYVYDSEFLFDFNNDFDLYFDYKSADFHGLCIGVTTSTPPTTNTTVTDGAWFYIDSSNPYSCTSNGVANTNNSIAAITTTDWNRYHIKKVGSNIYFYVNGILKFTHSTHISTATDTSPIIYEYKDNGANTQYLARGSFFFKGEI